MTIQSKHKSHEYALDMTIYHQISMTACEGGLGEPNAKRVTVKVTRFLLVAVPAH